MTDLNKSVSRKNALIIIIFIIVFVLVLMAALALSHTAYQNNAKTIISNKSDFTETAPGIFVYGYDDEKTYVDIREIVKTDKKAIFSILNVMEKDSENNFNPIDKANEYIDVENKIPKYVTIKVSDRGKSKQYMIILVAKSCKNQFILENKVILNGNFLDEY